LANVDDLLLEQARRCQDEAIVQIYDHYAHTIYRYLYRLVGDAWVAEDLTSEVFIKLLSSLGTCTAPRRNLPGWLYRVARNLAMDWYREQAHVTAGELREDLLADGDLPAVRVARGEQQRQLGQAILKLTADQQQVILLRFGDGLDITQVGRILRKSEGAIKALQYRAVHRLAALLQAEGEKTHVPKTGERVRSIAAASSPGRNP